MGLKKIGAGKLHKIRLRDSESIYKKEMCSRMLCLCFGTFFTLLCGNKKDWDKSRKPKVPNRILYAALLDIVDKKAKPKFHVDDAKSSNKDYIASDAKLCKRDDHPIQRRGAVINYIDRFENKHDEVLLDFANFINEYLDEFQLRRLALSVLELIIKSDIPDSDLFCIESSYMDKISKKAICDTKRDFNLPALLAGVVYYILKNNVPNGSESAQATIEEWNEQYEKAPKCPIGADLGADYKIKLTCGVPDCPITTNGDEFSKIQRIEKNAEVLRFLDKYLRQYFLSLKNLISDAKLYFADNNYPSKLQDVYVSLPVNLRVDLEVKDKVIVGIRLLQIDDNGQEDETEAFEPVDKTRLHSFLSCLNRYVSENKEYKYQDRQKRPKILAPTFSDGEKIAFWEINGIDAAAIFDQFVILGDPGKGKSTLFKFFSLKLMEQYYSEENVFADYSISDEFYLSKYVPVFIEIKDIVSWYKDEKLKQFDSKAMFRYLSKRYVPDWKKEFPDDNIFTHNCIYLLDGLDEIDFNPENRNFVVSLIQFIQRILKNKCKLLISCRKRDFSDWDLSAINIYHLRSMNDYIASQLIQQIFKTKLKAIPSTRLLDELHGIGIGVDLVGNPLFLSLIAHLYLENQKDFPSTKSRILRESILLLLKRKRAKILEKFSSRDGVEELFPALESIAFEMQRSANKPSFRISSKDLTGIVCDAIGYCTRNELYDFLASTTGLIMNVGKKMYEFSHRRFQEYLCASYLFNQKTAIEAALIIKSGLLHKKRIWSEAAIWYLEMICDHDDTERIVITLKQLAADNKDGWVSWYIGRIIESKNCQLIDQNSHFLTNNDIEQLRELLLSAFLDVDSLPVSERAFCGKILGYLGDPRHGVSLNAQGMPDIAWCYMKAGLYKIGASDEAQKIVKDQIYGNNKWGTKIIFSREIPQSEIQLNEFYISKYPVTVAQFHAFVDSDDGYFCYDNWRWSEASSEWYRLNVVDKTIRQIKNQKGKSNAPNFPVTNVSWIEAVAFCKWLSKKTKKNCRLPTEGEWEAASRSSCTVFAWGDEFEPQKCNSSFSGIGDIVPVGMFSAFVEDDIPSEMNGNVWDWCYSVYPAWDSKVENLSVYNENKNIIGSCNYNRLTLNTMCSVRGGSYINTPMFLMSSFRGRDKISLSFYRQGFRIVKEVVSHPLENVEVLLEENREIPSQLEYFKEGAGVLVSDGDRVRLSYSVMKDGDIIEDMTKPDDHIEVVLGKGQLQQEIDEYILAHNPRISTSFDTCFSVFIDGSEDGAEIYRFYIQIMDRE